MGRTDFKNDEAMAKLVGLLLKGEVLTAKSIAKHLGIKRAAAQRKLRALQSIDGAVAEKRGREQAVKFATLLRRTPVGGLDVAAACLMSSLGSALRDTGLREPLRKLVDGLVQRSRAHHTAAELDRKFWFVVRGGEAALPRKNSELLELVEALLASRSIRFAYQHFDGRREAVTTRPLTLALHDHQFYLIGWSASEPQFYAYRFSRMSDVTAHARFDYPTQGIYDPAVLFRATFGIFVANDHPVEKVRLRLKPGWRHYVEAHRWHDSQEHTPRADGSVDLALSVRVCPELKRWLLWFGSDADVLEPAHLRAWVARELTTASLTYSRRRTAVVSAKPRRPETIKARPRPTGKKTGARSRG